MIITGNEILKAWHSGDITIDPFDCQFLNPNSYNYRLSNQLIIIQRDEDANDLPVKVIKIKQEGYLLQPGTLYLASTYEIIGSTKYVVTLLGRSSIGRLGLFLNITADLGHAGAKSQWTLELEVVQPLRIYPFMKIGQVAFWDQMGTEEKYHGRYQNDLGPIENRDKSILTPNHKWN